MRAFAGITSRPWSCSSLALWDEEGCFWFPVGIGAMTSIHCSTVLWKEPLSLIHHGFPLHISLVILSWHLRRSSCPNEAISSPPRRNDISSRCYASSLARYSAKYNVFQTGSPLYGLWIDFKCLCYLWMIPERVCFATILPRVFTSQWSSL